MIQIGAKSLNHDTRHNVEVRQYVWIPSHVPKHPKAALYEKSVTMHQNRTCWLS